MTQSGTQKAFKLVTIQTRADFLAARAGVRANGEFIRMEGCQRSEDRFPDTARVGFTATKKTGNSVERNRMKRRLRAAVRACGADSMQPGHDYVIISRRSVLSAPFDALTRDIDTTTCRINNRLAQNRLAEAPQA